MYPVVAYKKSFSKRKVNYKQTIVSVYGKIVY